MSSIDKLITLLNRENIAPFVFTPHNITFGTPVPTINTPEKDGIGPWNTKIPVRAVPGSGYKGTVLVKYRRLVLNELGPTVGVMSEDQFTPESVIDAFNDATCSFVDIENLRPISIPEMGIGEIVSIVFRSVPDSLGTEGDVVVQMLRGLPPEVDLLHHLIHVILPTDNYLIYEEQ